MTTCPGQLERRSLRAPREDGGMLIRPSLQQVASMVAENVQRRTCHECDCQGRLLADLAADARKEMLDEARRWTAAYRDTSWSLRSPERPVFLAGHQPQLFHPGVWLKNFVLGHVARQHGALAVSLLIDSDTIKDMTVPVPGGTVADPRVDRIPLDRPLPRVPYEERRVVDHGLFGEFGPRVAAQISPLVADPLILRYWPLVQDRLRETDLLGACLAQARHGLEARWGLQTLEVPQSRLCERTSFRWLAAHLLAQLPRFREIHAGALREFRKTHRIRSAAHPVADLTADGSWLEAPFWVWTPQRPHRRPLFVRRQTGRIVLSDRQGLELALSLTPDGEATRAVEQLGELARRGVRIRPRALITTLWARLLLGELFVHGIGGAKYDALTDRLIERFFRLPAPRFLVVSGTLRLPIQRPRVSRSDARAIRQELRDLTHHPECHLNCVDCEAAGGAASAKALVAEKMRWIRTPQTPRNARARWVSIRRINAALQEYLEPQRRRLLCLQAETARALEAEKVLGWREYGFCLYPEGDLREFFGRVLFKTV